MAAAAQAFLRSRQDVGQQKPPAWTDSERARLDTLLKEREFAQQIKARNTKRWEAVKAWAQWIMVIFAAGGVIWDKVSLLLDFARVHIR